MRSLMGAFVIALSACVGSGAPGAITGTPRPLGTEGSAIDPTAGEIRILPWGWSMDNIRSPSARRASTTDTETIRRAFREELGAILSCYERGRRDAPELRGIVRTRFIIELDGRTRKVEAYGMDSMVAGCLRDIIFSMMFPEPNTVPLRIEMPFAFSPPPEAEPIAEVGPD